MPVSLRVVAFMAKPRSKELARSGHAAVDPDSAAATAPLSHDVHEAGTEDSLGPIPEGNRPPIGGPSRARHRPRYEQWTKDELYQRARELDIAGRSSMTKAELVDALSNG